MTTLATYPQAAPSRTEFLMPVAPGVAGLQTIMVNLYFLGEPDNWVLVDAGVPMQANRIIRAAEERFGRGARPSAIILTHGHFDHVSRLSPLFPRHAYDFRPNLRELPSDHRVPGVDGWRWIHTPGHSPGHVSLFRDSDRTLIAGDAFTTQQQESFLAVMTNTQHVHGPPMYFTIDWMAARESVQRLARLEPSAAGAGHGLPMFGDRLRSQLTALSLHFRTLGMPRSGRYVRYPAITDETGVRSVPPAVFDPVPAIIAAVAALGIGAAIVATIRDRDQR